MASAGVQLNAVDSVACTNPTSLPDPLVAAGGAYRPFDSLDWMPAGPAQSVLLLLAGDTATWMSPGTNLEMSPLVEHPNAYFVGAMPTDDGGVLLLSSPPSASPSFTPMIFQRP